MDGKSKDAAIEKPPAGGEAIAADINLEIPTATNFDGGVDVPDVPPSPPVWEDPEFIAPLVIIGDDREYSVIQKLLKLRCEISKLLNTAIGECSPHDATATLMDACMMEKAYRAKVKELQTMRIKGIRKVTVVRVQGPRVGLAAKTRALSRPDITPMLANLIEEVEFMKDHFSLAADRFLRKADTAYNHIGDGRYSGIMGIELIKRKDISALRKASVKASRISSEIGILIDEITRDHRQVIVREEIVMGSDAAEPVRKRRSGPLRTCDMN